MFYDVDFLVMSVAWRERDSQARIAAARRALRINPDCAPAMILLAEEQCGTIAEVEETLRKALKIVEAFYKRSQALSYVDIEAFQSRFN